MSRYISVEVKDEYVRRFGQKCFYCGKERLFLYMLTVNIILIR